MTEGYTEGSLERFWNATTGFSKAVTAGLTLLFPLSAVLNTSRPDAADSLAAFTGESAETVYREEVGDEDGIDLAVAEGECRDGAEGYWLSFEAEERRGFGTKCVPQEAIMYGDVDEDGDTGLVLDGDGGYWELDSREDGYVIESVSDGEAYTAELRRLEELVEETVLPD